MVREGQGFFPKTLYLGDFVCFAYRLYLDRFFVLELHNVGYVDSVEDIVRWVVCWGGTSVEDNAGVLKMGQLNGNRNFA
jgi:hypothetical protein